MNKSPKTGRPALMKGSFVVLAFVFAPGLARAGCGEYGPLAGQAGLAAPAQDATAPGHREALDPPSGRSPAPCTGPTCSRDPFSSPAQVPSTVTSPPSDNWAINPSHNSLIPLRGFAFLRDQILRRAIHRSLPIFHPPRA